MSVFKCFSVSAYQEVEDHMEDIEVLKHIKRQHFVAAFGAFGGLGVLGSRRA